MGNTAEIARRIAAALAAAALIGAVQLLGTRVASAQIVNSGGDDFESWPSDTVLYLDDYSGSTDMGVPGWFVFLMVVAVIVGLATTAWKVMAAQDMAREAGMNPGRAGAMTLLSEDGFDATYLAASLRTEGRSPIAPSKESREERVSEPSVADRLRTLADLRNQGVITNAEYAERRAEIIDTI